MIRQLRLTIALLFLAGVGASLSIRQISHADRASQVVQATAAVSATRETTPVPHTGDAADDPAFWIHPSDPAQSTILGTDKLGGLAVYDLAGNQLQYLADGAMNNVDLRYNFPLGDQPVALVTAGNLANNSLAIYRVDPATRQLVSVAARTITPGLSIYGSCMYHSPLSGTFYVFLDAKNGSVEQWELFATTGGRVDAARVRSFGVGSQVEGCVADDEAQAFYISEEAVGIWRYGAEPGAGVARTQVDTTAVGGHVTSNIEGLAIYYTSSGGGYLIASSQGSDDFAIYRRGDNAYVGTFAIAAGNGIDHVSNTDGIDVANFGLGGAFPQGLFVAQDGSNDTGNQNFKLVPWQAIAAAFTPALTIDTSWDPRLVGGGPLPTSTPTATPNGTPSPTPTMQPTSTATPAPTTFTFNPVADTYVSQANPTTSYAGSTQLQAVGGSSAKQAFLRFTVSGLPAGLAVQSAKLRLTVVNDSTSGGIVQSLSNTTWSESMTWSTGRRSMVRSWPASARSRSTVPSRSTSPARYRAMARIASRSACPAATPIRSATPRARPPRRLQRL